MLFKDENVNSYFSKSESMQLLSTLTTKLKLEEDTIENESGSLENTIDCINELNNTCQVDNEGIAEDVVMEEEDDDDDEDQNEQLLHHPNPINDGVHSDDCHPLSTIDIIQFSQEKLKGKDIGTHRHNLKIMNKTHDAFLRHNYDRIVQERDNGEDPFPRNEIERVPTTMQTCMLHK